MKATLKNYRQSPRKVRLIADLVRGKSISTALSEVSFLSKRAAGPFKKVIESALANAKQNDGKSEDSLFVKEVQVDKGLTLKRWRPRAFGRAAPIHKHSSHITVVLGEAEAKKAEKKSPSVGGEKEEAVKKGDKIEKKDTKKENK